MKSKPSDDSFSRDEIAIMVARLTPSHPHWIETGGEISKKRWDKKRCTYQARFRKGTFFARSHLSIWQILVFANLWVMNVDLNIIGK
jgi:hypothetical protein